MTKFILKNVMSIMAVCLFSLQADAQYEPRTEVVFDKGEHVIVDNRTPSRPSSSADNRTYDDRPRRRKPKRSSSISFASKAQIEEYKIKQKASNRIKKYGYVVLLEEDNSVSVIFKDGYGFEHWNSERGTMYSDGAINDVVEHIFLYQEDGYANFVNIPHSQRYFEIVRHKLDID